MAWRWRTIVALAVAAFGLLGVVGASAVLSGGTAGIRDGLIAAFIVATLGGLVVVPGVAMLGRLARGVPVVRIDDTGVVWGRDRSRDLSIDWADIESAAARSVRSQGFTERAFVLMPRPGAAAPAPGTLYGRFVAASNRAAHRTPFAISTRMLDGSWEEIRAALAGHLGERLIVER
jgi:hypothetical protein